MYYDSLCQMEFNYQKPHEHVPIWRRIANFFLYSHLFPHQNSDVTQDIDMLRDIKLRASVSFGIIFRIVKVGGALKDIENKCIEIMKHIQGEEAALWLYYMNLKQIIAFL